MRRPVIGAMCGLTVVVVSMAVRAGSAPVTHSAVGAAPSGVVGTGTTSSPTAPASPAPVVAHRVVAAHKKATSAATGTATAVTTPTSVRVATTSPSPTATHAVTSTTVNGSAADTRYGPVQVQIVVRGGKIVRADAIDYPQGDPHDQEINSYAIPQLDQETVQAQSAQIDSVSGATYTSEGYVGSLQSAIDSAHKAGLL